MSRVGCGITRSDLRVVGSMVKRAIYCVIQLLYIADMKRFDHYPQHWVNRLGFLIRKRIGQAFEADGLAFTPEDWAVLLVLKGQSGATMSELSDITFRDKTTMTRQVDRLARQGLVVRRESQHDRRSTHLFLTDTGEAAFLELAVHAQDLIARSSAGITPEDLETTTRTLARMVDNLTTD